MKPYRLDISPVEALTRSMQPQAVYPGSGIPSSSTASFIACKYLQVFDPVIILNAPVRIRHIFGTQPVFDDEQRFLVPVVQRIHRRPQARGINGPAPVAGFQAGIFNTLECVAGLLPSIGPCGNTAAAAQ